MLPAFSPLPTMLSKVFFVRVVKVWDCGWDLMIGFVTHKKDKNYEKQRKFRVFPPFSTM